MAGTIEEAILDDITHRLSYELTGVSGPFDEVAQEVVQSLKNAGYDIVPTRATIDYVSQSGAFIHYELHVLDVDHDDNGLRPALKTWKSEVKDVPQQRYWMTISDKELATWWVKTDKKEIQT